MTAYRILIADDQVSQNSLIYDRLVKDVKDTEITVFDDARPSDPDTFREELKRGYDLVLLDVNLDDWGITLKDAFSYVGSNCPVVLVSQLWSASHTHRQVVDAMAGAKHVRIVGTLGLDKLSSDGWKDYAVEMQSLLRLAIASHRRRGLLELRGDEEFRILHLSDPQYRDPKEDPWAFLVERQVAKFIRHNLQQKIHLIAITGDITYSGHPDEYEYAEKKLSQLAEAFLPNREDWRERLLLVPGNHDVNLRLAAADAVSYSFSKRSPEFIDPVNSSLRCFALRPFRDFAWRLTGDPQWRDAEDLCWINDSFRHLGLRLYLLNSVATLDCREPKLAEVSPDTLNKLDGQSDYISSEPLFSIALSHHGRELPEQPAVEGINNWAQLAQTMRNVGVKLWLHGHGHQRMPARCPLDDNEQVLPTTGGNQGKLNSNEILRVMAPTTHLNEELRPPKERRGFNLITLQRSYGRVEGVEVDSFEVGAGDPKRAKHAPWNYRV